MADITGEVLRGRYQIERLLGRGGMADVYLAFDMHRHTHVALKLIREDLADDADFIRRFSREAAALARLDHPNVVRFYSTEQDGALAFIVMDYVPGSTLQRRIAQVGGPMSVAETSSVLNQIGPALHYAHSLGFIHRDIKPGNIMLRDDGTALLSDFGAARVSESATLASLTIGTPAYMSPEQILGRDLTAQSDIYSFGLVLYEMLAGRRAFTGDEEGLTGTGTISRLREAHLRLDPRNPAELNPQVTPALADVVLKSLAKDLTVRWPTMVSLIDAWEAITGKAGRRTGVAGKGATAATTAAFGSAETIAAPFPTSGETRGTTQTGAAAPLSMATGAAGAQVGTLPTGSAGAPPSVTGMAPAAVPAPKKNRGGLVAGVVLAALVIAALVVWRVVLPGMTSSGTASQVQVGAATATEAALAVEATRTAEAALSVRETADAAQAALQQRADQVATAEAAATAAAVQLAATASAAGKVVEQAAAIAATATAEAVMAPQLTSVAAAAATEQAAIAAATATASAEAEAAAQSANATATASAVTPTATPTVAKPAGPSPTPLPLTAGGKAATAAPAQPGGVTDFETNSTWQIGDQKYGSLQRSTEQAHSGGYSQKLAYNFPAVTDNFVVFTSRPPVPLPGQPTGISAWVYGDGSGHFLNAWLRDSAGEVRQYTFGQVAHEGWQQMTAWFDDARGWPNVRISGTDNGKLDLPASLLAIVLDGVPDGQASNGTIYIDDIRTATGAIPSGAAGTTSGVTPAQPGTTEAAPAALSGKVAVPVFAGDRRQYDLYVGPASGDGLGRIQASASQPDLSPNGGLVTYRGWQNSRGIQVMPAGGGGTRQLTTFYEDELPSWSPDGGTIVFSSKRESDRKSRLYQVPASGGGDFVMKQGADPIYGEYPTWLADGTIVYRSTYPVQGLVVIGADGSNPVTLFADGSSTAPAGSPRSAVAFMSLKDGNWEIYRINRDGSGLARLTNNGANDGLPAWSPDGSAIAFVSDRDGSWGVWVMGADGSGQRKLYALPGSIDGRVAGEPDYSSGGWTEERLSWSR